MDAWKGDSRKRISDGAKKNGFPSVLAFAQVHPTLGFEQLAELLGENIAPIQVLWLLREEYVSASNMRGFAISCFVRYFTEIVPKGWRVEANFDFKFAHALACWSSSLGSELEQDCDVVIERFNRKSLPTGWLPSGEDDPIVSEIFSNVQFKCTSTER